MLIWNGKIHGRIERPTRDLILITNSMNMRAFKRSDRKIISILILFVAYFLTGCKFTEHSLYSPDVGEFFPSLIGSYSMKRGAKETTELVVLRKSRTKPNAYEFIEGNTTRRDLRLIKLGNWLFVEADCGSYYCAWRYTNDDGVITLYSVDGSREADSRTMDFLRSLKIEGHSTTAEELTKDFNSLWTLGGSDLRDSPSPSHQPSPPPPSKVDVPSAAAGSDLPQVIGEIPTPRPAAHSTLETRDLQKAFRKYGDTFNRVYAELRKIN